MKCLAFCVLVFSVFMSAEGLDAQVRYDTICAGQEKGWFLDEGSSLVVMYYANGSPKTSAFKQNWFNWLMSDPLVAVNVYYSPWPLCPTTPIYTTSVDPFYRSYALPKTGGVYFFKFTAYRASAPVYLKIY